MRNSPADQTQSDEFRTVALHGPAQFLPSSLLAWRTPIAILNALNMEPPQNANDSIRPAHKWNSERLIFQEEDNVID
jgi:hypothetical protein